VVTRPEGGFARTERFPLAPFGAAGAVRREDPS
jgi:hypothetical protein